MVLLLTLNTAVKRCYRITKLNFERRIDMTAIAQVAYEVTKSGDRFRSARALLEDKDIRSEMKKTSEAFNIVTGRRRGECVESKKVT